MWLPENIRFKCQQECSACCRLGEGKVYLTEKEAHRIAEFLDISESDFLERYTSTEDERFVLKDGKEQTCIFLSHPRCTVYDVRPLQCRTYPFWTENLKNRNRWKLTREECPGIGKGDLYTTADIRQVLSGRSIDSEK